MGLKFGSLFGDFTDQLKKAFSSSAKNIDLSELEEGGKLLKALGERSKELAKEIIELEKIMAKAGEGTEEYVEAEKAKKRATMEAKIIAEQETIERKNLKKSQEAVINQLKTESKERIKIRKSLEEVNDDYDKQFNKLINSLGEGKISQKEFDEQLNKIDMEKIGGQIAVGLFEPAQALEELGMMAADQLTSMLMNFLPPQFRILGEVIKKAILESFKQIIELNKALVGLTRSTSGLIDAAKLGFDSTGNLATGVKSLKTMAAEANLSVEEFTGALTSLASESFGQTIGAAQDLTKATKDFQDYAITAGRLQKMYGADMGASVRNLFQNFGQSIGSATKIMKEGADKALALGLNVKGFVSNFEQVTNLIGEVYFRTTEEMTKMAMVATKLGTSVDTLAGGLTKMAGINDLFQQQQRTAALGLNNYARALSQVYALQKAGKGAQAAQLELATLAQDMKQYLDENGQITQAGLDTLKAQGLSAQQIEAVAKMARDPLALKSVMSPESLTSLEKKQVERKEQENMSLEEKFNTAMTQLQALLIDPFTKYIGPYLKMFAEGFLVVIQIISESIGIFRDLFSPIIVVIQEISIQFHKAIMDIFNPLKESFSKIRQAIQPLVNMWQTVGKTIIQWLLFPIRLLGKAMGFIIDVFYLIITKIIEAFHPLYESISELFNLFEGGEGFFTLLLDAIGVVFDWLLEGIGMLIDIALWPLTTLIGLLVEYAIKPVIDIFKEMKKNFEDAINRWPLSIFFGEEEEESGDMIDPAAYAKFFESPLTATENVSATAPAAKSAVFIPMSANSDAIANEQLMTQAFGQGQINPNTTVIVNNDIEGIFNDKQTIKKTV